MVTEELIPTEEIGGTSLMGYVHTSYDDLVAVFGEPHFYEPGTDDKVQCEWGFEYDGEVFTIGQVYGPWLCMAYTRRWWQCFSFFGNKQQDEKLDKRK